MVDLTEETLNLYNPFYPINIKENKIPLAAAAEPGCFGDFPQSFTPHPGVMSYFATFLQLQSSQSDAEQAH